MSENIHTSTIVHSINDLVRVLEENKNIESVLNFEIDKLNNSRMKLKKLMLLNKNKIPDLVIKVDKISKKDSYSQSLLKSLNQFYSGQQIDNLEQQDFQNPDVFKQFIESYQQKEILSLVSVIEEFKQIITYDCLLQKQDGEYFTQTIDVQRKLSTVVSNQQDILRNIVSLRGKLCYQEYISEEK